MKYENGEVTIDYGDKILDAEKASGLVERLNVENTIRAADIREINRNMDADCLAETILESTFDAIADVNLDGYRNLDVDILEEFKKQLKEIKYNFETIETAMDEIYDYLTLYGYKVKGILKAKDFKWIKEAKFTVEW